MKERPILFSGPMVRAILEGRKTQTRRVVKNPYTPGIHQMDTPPRVYDCPYGQPGDRLWVRETWRLEDFEINGGDFNASVRFRVDDALGVRRFGLTADEKVGWRPSVFMPRWASRLTLEITGVRVERVQDISEQDAIAEGMTERTRLPGMDPLYAITFAILWNEINAKRGYNWESNPRVWVVEFKRC